MNDKRGETLRMLEQMREQLQRDLLDSLARGRRDEHAILD